jgi:hypothetical protein
MNYISLTKNTWTKISDPTGSCIVVQLQRPSGFQFSFGEPSAGQSGYILQGNDLLSLNCGTGNEELWLYCFTNNTAVCQGVV